MPDETDIAGTDLFQQKNLCLYVICMYVCFMIQIYILNLLIMNIIKNSETIIKKTEKNIQ